MDTTKIIGAFLQLFDSIAPKGIISGFEGHVKLNLRLFRDIRGTG